MSPKASAIDQRELRFQIEELLADYVDCVNDEELERWPQFFTDDCTYKVISHENFEQNLPLGTIFCEGRAGLADRVNSIRETAVYRDRILRHVVGPVKIVGTKEEWIDVRANFSVFETLPDELTRVFMVGRYVDTLTFVKGQLKFHEKLCVYDSALISASLVYPV